MYKSIIRITIDGILEERTISKEKIRLIRKIIDNDAFAAMISDMIENDSTI